ncbi:hypothetical protein M427DRAFT_51131 [Gonapodya prolifera JEL478]|uniref:Uncharacterized protein n=1 Tax=Gonapodya prolifera (strain JEL478) TaxID=1344416 RepID=A0A139AYE3_GONPJ|nr:hypothetical protein M427DRAFT_51131 [Gonapodya prolifera JEL478]|eukprot:KXS21749.1 hypothetical protein M427DRAFT_51131 [Gonapodya prolifera JEL478]
MDQSSLELAGMAVMSTQGGRNCGGTRFCSRWCSLFAASIIPQECPTFPSSRMDLDAMTPADCRLRFTFDKTDMPRLQQALHIPAIVSMDNRLIVPGIEVLCTVLRHLSFPTRLDDLSKEFGREGSEISRIYQWGIAHICAPFKVLQEYADAVKDAGAPYVDCFGFVDGTVWQICRPLQYQRQLFNLHC